jgi:hypothetical protein
MVLGLPGRPSSVKRREAVLAATLAKHRQQLATLTTGRVIRSSCMDTNRGTEEDHFLWSKKNRKAIIRNTYHTKEREVALYLPVATWTFDADPRCHVERL